MTGVLFDVDGTLVDSNALHAVCWAEAFAQHDVDVTTARLLALIGMEADRLIREVLKGQPGGDQQDEQTRRDEIKAAHSTLYAQYYGHLRPFGGSRALLEALAPVVLASSASGPELAALRTALDADQWIKDATSGDDVGAGKPDPDLVQRGLELLGTDDAVYVGDSVWDGEACRQACVPFVGLTCGGTSLPALKDAGAVEVWADPQDLLDHLDDSILRRNP